MNDAYDVVIPTIGRPSLLALLRSLEAADGPLPQSIIVVDDRRDRSQALPREPFVSETDFSRRIAVIAGAAAGPAAARNRGWRHASAPWVAFLDDDVVVDEAWRRELAADLASCGARVAGVAGNVTVPLEGSRRPTDWERNVRGLEGAKYITADFAFRRAALERAGGFDERFPRAYREDADLALRILADGWTLEMGRRRVRHPVRPADAWISVRLQAGNADDVLMEALHGREWHDRATSWRDQFRAYVATVACAVASVAFAIVFVGRVLRFAWRRIAPGPRTPRETATMLATSALIPFAATFHRVLATSRIRATLRRPARRAAAVLFDRDGTLIEDVPGLRDPHDVRPVDGALSALARLRHAGIACCVVTNQPRVGEGDLAVEELSALHARLDRYLGPFATIQACVHARDAGCACRKPEPGLVIAAAREAGARPADCIVVGDIGSDVDAARAAGARAILVPTRDTLADEIARAPHVARDLGAAVDLILSGAV